MNIPHLPYAKDRLFGFLFLIVLLIPLAFSVFNYESFETIKYGLLLILTGGALFVNFRKPAVLNYSLRGSGPFFLTLSLFWLWAFLASVFAWDKNYSFFGFYARFTNGFIFYSVWVLLIFILSFLNFEQIKILLKTLVLCSGLVALWGLLQSIGVGFYFGVTTDFFNRGAVSFLGNPNFASMFVAALVPLSALFCYQAKSLKGRFYYAINIFFQLWSLSIFASRGALLALFLGLSAMILMAVFFKKRDLKLLALLLVIFLLAFGFSKEFINFSRPNTVQVTENFSDPNIQNRLGVWKLSVFSIIKRPVLGVGLGNFQLMFEHDRKNPIISSGFFDDAHNLFLELGVSGGIPFVLLFLFLLAFALLNVVKKMALNSNAEAAAVISCILAWLMAGMFNPVPITLYILLAVLLSACFKENLVALPSGLFEKLKIRKILLLLGIMLIIYGALFEIAENLFYAGVRAYNSNRFAEAYKYATAAIRLNPVNRLYYVYQAGSAIRSNQPLERISSIMATASRFNPKRAHNYVQEANLYYLLLYQTKDPVYQNKILDRLSRAIQLDPFFSDNYFTLAQYQMIFNNPSDSILSLKKGLSLNPQNLEAWAFMAKIFQIQGDQKGLMEVLNQALKTQPDNLGLIKLIRLAKDEKNLQSLPFTVHLGIGRLD